MTRRIFLFLALIASAIFFTSNAKADDGSIRVMSFNILCSKWDGRRDLVIDEINECDPLLLGVQEATAPQMDDLCKALSDYAFVGVGRDDGERGGEFSAVFYKKAAFELLDSGTFWLSETPEQAGSQGWDAACKRVVSWGKFRCKKSGKTFVYANTHFDHRGETARVESAKLVVTRAAELTDHGNTPFFISGDFNCNNTTEAYKILTKGLDGQGGFADSFETALECVAPVKRTYNDFGHVSAESATEHIDFIFVNDKVAVEKFVISPDLRNGQHPSDHNSIYADLRLK